uniref:EGF-like domain-containing protein n=1 Tax=Macrostomum lignano TaxID=282301 RepID=A0A1I8FLG4_9PLAT
HTVSDKRYGQPIHKFSSLIRWFGYRGRRAEVNLLTQRFVGLALPTSGTQRLFRDRSQNKVDFFVRFNQNQCFTYSDTGYFSPQSITAVTFRRPAGQAVGSLAEIVSSIAGVDTVAFVSPYGGVPASDACCGFYDPHGVASANVATKSLRRILDMTAQTQGFLSDRTAGLSVQPVQQSGKCLNIASETMRVIVTGLNSYLGNGLTAMDERKTTTYASWTIEQTIWNQVLFKATTPQLRLDMPEGFHFTRLVGNVTRLRTCRDLTCGPGSQCVVEGPVGQAQCRCLPGYVESGAGACRAVLRPEFVRRQRRVPDQQVHLRLLATLVTGWCVRLMTEDCRFAQAACRPEDGFACMQQATRSGIEYRCQCAAAAAKCIREADAACRQQAGCSQFANCLPGANGGPSHTCGDGRVCLPELCADNATCSDAGAYAFCNASPPVRQPALRPRASPRAGASPGLASSSDCMEKCPAHRCDPVSNACVCKAGFAANRLGGCSHRLPNC